MKALVISAGLMGGSITKALVKAGWEIHVTARTPLKYDGITFYTDFSHIPKIDFDIICICSPRGRKYEIYEEMFAEASRLSTKNTFIVDISSVQNQNNLFQLKYPNFVPCHPIAGSEKTGFENSSPEILKGKKCLVVKENPPQKVLDFWHACGMVVDNSITSCMEHDRIFAKVSHLPQLISFNLPPEEKPQYKEFYRLKNSSREIWDEIFLHNRSSLLEALMEFQKQIHLYLFNDNTPHWEKIVGDIFLQITTEKEKSYAGSGFKTITVARHLSIASTLVNTANHIDDELLTVPKSNDVAIEVVKNIIQKSLTHLTSL
jgi:prephenate dehydrogenase